MTMKKALLLMAVVGFLMSCKSSIDAKTTYPDENVTVSTETDTESETAENTMDSMDDTETAKAEESMDMEESADSMESTADTEMAVAMDSTMEEDYSEMYEGLEMSDDQIQEFETGMENLKEAMASDPNGEMRGSLEDQKQQLLANILTGEQLQKYTAWKKDN